MICTQSDYLWSILLNVGKLRVASTLLVWMGKWNNSLAKFWFLTIHWTFKQIEMIQDRF